MAKRDAHYAEQSYDTDYPQQDEMVRKDCDVCGLAIVVNNWPDKKTRTPKFKGLVVCPECDPRHPEDRYMKEGYRILHPRRLRIIKMALVTQKQALRACTKLGRSESFLPNCKCVPCVAGRLFPPF